MMRTKVVARLGLRLAIASSLLFALLAAPLTTVLADGGQDEGRPSGAVFTLTNAADGNEVLAFQRAEDGSLTPAGAFATGGLGSGSGLGSQSALVLSEDNRQLLAVNAGSNQISVFEFTPHGLRLTDIAGSGGQTPISLAIHKDLVYVLNAGGAGNITAFKLSNRGHLYAIPNSTRYLSNGGVGDSTGPAQISFTPDGKSLVVTEKATNQILIYQVKKRRAEGPTIFASSGQTPFGFAFAKRDILIVSEAFGGAPGASTASSYQVSGGNLELVNGSVPTFQTAACWVAVSKNGKFAYTTNTGSNSITGYRVDNRGNLTLLDADGFTGFTGDGSRPIDMAFSRNGRYLYALSGGSFTISAFTAHSDGSLESLRMVSVPTGSVGLAAF